MVKPRRIFGLAILGIVFFLPGGMSFSPLAWLENIGQRISTPITQDEQAELDFLGCTERVSLAIPDGSDVLIVTDGNSYFVQRAQDILYPRVRLVSDNHSYEFRLGIPVEKLQGLSLVASENCSGLQVEVVKID